MTGTPPPARARPASPSGTGKPESSDRLLTATGAKSNNSTKGTPAIQADLLGDWREELAWPSSDSTELRIYTTTAGTDVRLRTLMHDPVYRQSVARENIAYNQPPHPSFFIGEGMELPAQPDITYTGAEVATGCSALPGERNSPVPPKPAGGAVPVAAMCQPQPAGNRQRQ